MGMDVFGRNPSSEAGRYFRRSVWSWHPLAELVCSLAPAEAVPCTLWHTNDGGGLDGNQAVILAHRLQELADDGTIAARVKARTDYLDGLADLHCSYCEGSGIRADARGKELSLHQRVIGKDTGAALSHPRLGQTGWCNSCNGIGHLRPSETLYHVETDDVVEFIDFLRNCGGFEIC